MAPIQHSRMSGLERFIRTLKTRPLDSSVQHLILLLKNREISGSKSCAVATAHILRQVVAKAGYKDVDKLIEKIQRVGQRLVRALPHELVVGNVVRRVLGLIRDEVEEDRTEFGTDSVSDIQPLTPDAMPHRKLREPPSVLSAINRTPTLPNAAQVSFSTPFSLLSLLSPQDSIAWSGTGSPMARSGTSTPLALGPNSTINSLRSEVIEGIDEIMDEIEQSDDLVAAHADIQIHPTDYVLVYEPDSTVERFILRAAQKRRFTVLIVNVQSATSAANEVSPSPFQKKLHAAGISTIKVTNSGLTTYMTKIDKVILSARGVTADGGAVVESGASAIARAAREFAKPVAVLAGIYKLSAENPGDVRSLVEWGIPESFVTFSNGTAVEEISVEVPISEFVPAGLIDTYISNIGVHSGDHLHSLIGDHYNDEDLNFQLIEFEN